jgi:hypothetical protein
MRFHKLRRDYTSGIGSPTTSTIVVSVCTGELSGVVPLGRLDGFTDSSFTSRHRYNPLGVRHCPPRLIASCAPSMEPAGRGAASNIGQTIPTVAKLLLH